MNGYLKIKTKIDNSEVDKDIKTLEDKIKKIQTDNTDLSKEQDNLQEQINNYNKLIEKAEEYKNKMNSLQTIKNGKLQVTDKNQMLNLSALYSVANEEINKQAVKIDKVYARLSKVKKKQTENNAKISEFKQKIESINANILEKSINNVGKSIQKQVGKIGKMALAVVGIRTAWNAVRSAIGLVTQYNKQASTDFEYMRFCIANMLVPAVQGLIKLLYTLLSYVNAITTSWFGINLFSNSSAKAFKKMQSSASGTAKSAKEIQKSLQGFDEMNILQDNSNSDSSEIGGTPSMDLSGMQAEIPKWLQWIIDNKDLVVGTLLGIATGIIAVKLGIDLLKSTGIGLILFGVYETIKGLNDILNGDFIDGITKYLIGLTAIAGGIFILFGGIPALVTLIVGIIIGETAILFKYGDQIKEKFTEFTDWIYSLIDKDWREMFGPFFGSILNETVADIKDFIENSKKTLFGVIDFIQGIFTGDWKKAWEGLKTFLSGWIGQIFNIITIPFRAIGGIIEGIIASAINAFSKFSGFIKSLAFTVGKSAGNILGSAFKAVVNAVLSSVERILNTPIRAINGLIGVINAVPGVNLGYLSTFNLPRLAKGGVISQPTQAIVGEAGKEAVVPLENNLEWLDMLATKLANKIGSGSGSYILNIDSRTVQRGIAKKQQQLSYVTNGR